MSDNEIFLTQNSFSQPLDLSINTEIAGECAVNLLDFSLDCDFLENSPPEKKFKYEPAVSDISDDELVSSCIEVERDLNARFGDRPVDDEYVEQRSKKR